MDFQIALSTYKLYSQNKNYIYKIKAQVFLIKKKNPHCTHKARVIRLVFI